MNKIIQTDTFSDWFESLRDRSAKARIQMRIDRASLGNMSPIKLKPWDSA